MLGKLLLVCFVLLIALRVFAAGTLTDCSGMTLTSTYITSTIVKCWEFNAQDDTPAFYIMTNSALICFDSNIATEAIGAGRVMLRRCHTGVKPSSNPENECASILDTALDGTQGAAATQNACERVGPGTYYGEVTVSTGGQDASISFQGE